MQDHPATTIVRHRRENLKKCTLRGLEERRDMKFYTYPKKNPSNYEGMVLLDLEGLPLSSQDCGKPLLLLDATWRWADVMKRQLPPLEKRSLPRRFRTAYPRRQGDCPNPELGLASVEALFAAYHILGRDTSGLLDNYYWKEDFLKLNGFY